MAIDLADYSTDGPWGFVWPGCCCTDRTCWTVEDDFSGTLVDWDELSGEWQITSGELECVTEGVLITRERQPAPVRGTHWNHHVRVDLLDFPNSGTRSWKIIVGFEDVDNFDFVVFDYNAATENLRPSFWRRVAGVDSVVMDPDDYPGTPDWSGTAPGTESKTVYLCFAAMQWTAGELSIDAAGWEICGGGKDALPDDTDHGLVGFLGEDGSKFDNLLYAEHWESNSADKDCPYCACPCVNPNDGDDYACLGETLTGTLVRTSGPACAPLDGATVTFRQALLQEVVDPDSDCADPAAGFDDRANKDIWISDHLTWSTLGEQIYDDYWFRLKLICVPGGYDISIICSDPDSIGGFEADVDWSVSTCDPLYLVFHGLETAGISCDLDGDSGRKPPGCGTCVSPIGYQGPIYDVIVT